MTDTETLIQVHWPAITTGKSIQIHRHTLMYRHIHRHIHTHKYACTSTRVQIYTCAQTRTHGCVFIDIQTHMYTTTHMYMPPHICIYMYTFIYKHIHMHAQTHTHMYTHMLLWSCRNDLSSRQIPTSKIHPNKKKYREDLFWPNYAS